MSDMPEEIWAEYDGDGVFCAYDQFEGGTKRYVRADLHEALKAENERLREAAVNDLKYAHQTFGDILANTKEGHTKQRCERAQFYIGKTISKCAVPVEKEKR